MTWQLLLVVGICCLVPSTAPGEDSRPNILFCISDDQSWLHTGAMGDPVVKTPAFDRVAREGIHFTRAFCDAPSCGPSRSAILTGQHIWRLEAAGNIHSRLPDKFATYVGLLEEAGYVVGSHSKAWSPGEFYTPSGWVHSNRSDMNPAGRKFRSFAEFHRQKPKDKPFCFWLGSTDPHRGYKRDSGIDSGMDPAKVVVPAHLPDDPVVRRDILDYYFEVERFDRLVGEALAVLEKAGELDDTLVVVTSDNGMPFPRAKATLYDFGTRMPLAIRWPAKIRSPGRAFDGFVHLSDMAPTFLEAAGLAPPPAMTARSLTDVFAGDDGSARDAAFTAMERHDGCRKGGKGYPCRAIRTSEFLYIRNYEPGRWPAGDPDASNCARAIKCCSSSGPRALEMFARYLVGEVEGGVALTSLTPCSVDLPDSLGGARIRVTGNHPIRPNARIRVEEAAGKEFALEFRDPSGSRLKSARLNGREITPERNDRGFHRVRQAWKTGDELALEFEYLLKRHLVATADKPVWVAFTYGPWALSQTVDGSTAAAEPLVGKEMPALAVSRWLDPLTPGKNNPPGFRLKETDIVLGPYYAAGSRTAGPRTYFRVVPPGAVPRPAAAKRRNSTPRVIDISKAAAKVVPGWSVRNCGDAMKPGPHASFRGRSHVLVTHPKDLKQHFPKVSKR